MTDKVALFVSIMLALNLLIYVLLASRLNRIHEMVNIIGEMQHMQFFHPEELINDPCYAGEEVHQPQNTQNVKNWDEGE